LVVRTVQAFEEIIKLTFQPSRTELANKEEKTAAHNA
jgi:hypothetical protein